MTDGKIIIGTEIDSGAVDNWLDQLPDDVKKKINEAGKEAKDVADEYTKLMKQYLELTQRKKGEPIFSGDIKQAEMLKKQIKDVVKEIEKLTGEKITVPGITDTNEDKSKDIGKKLKDITKTIVKWSLALFGIRTIFGFISSSVNKITSNDPQLKADIDYMKSALAYTIEPLVRSIVNLVKQLMQYLAYIIYQWTGINIFENVDKNLDNANKKAKELKKITAGFDEINVLSNNSNKSTQPSFNFKNIEDMEAPKWLDDIVWFGEWVIDNWEDVIALLLGTKLVIDVLTGNWFSVVVDAILFLITQMPRLWEAIKIVWDGLVQFSVWIWDFIKLIDQKIDQGINFIISSLGSLIDSMKSIFGTVAGWIYDNVISPIANFFSGLWNGIGSAIKGVADTISGIFDGIKNTIAKALNLVIDGVNVLIDGLNLVNPFDNIPHIPRIGESKTASSTFSTNVGKSITSSMSNLASDLKRKIGFAKGGIVLPRLASGGIINMPGSGVPLGVGGERGPEGIIPLTDSQQMEWLGREIGKNITINATFPIYAYNRQVDKQIRRIKAEDDFLYNR